MADYKSVDIWKVDAVAENVQHLAEKSMRGGECLICPSCPYMRFSIERTAHAQGDEHLDRVRYMINQRKLGFSNFVKAQRLFSQHGHRSYIFTSKVQKLVFQYIFEDPSFSSTLDCAKRICIRYEREEPIAMLEMALWRTACILNPTKEDSQDMVHYCLCSGWKKNKNTHRHHSMIGIILKAVLPFVNIK
jgi:hypothetical protein